MRDGDSPWQPHFQATGDPSPYAADQGRVTDRARECADKRLFPLILDHKRLKVVAMKDIRRYLAEIGARGGRRSRRTLDADTARTMVQVREARRAFRRFRSTCFWSYRPDLVISAADVAWVAEQLMKHGNREAWRVGTKLLGATHDSAWRFMPLVRDPLGGLLLHPMDLAVNKVLALAGRDEPRDFVDILFVHRRVLPLAALSWAAVGKDPGFTPLSLLELLKRRGRYRPEDFSRLHLAEPFDLASAKQMWLAALAEAEGFARERPPEESGCLYYSPGVGKFVVPQRGAGLADQGIVPHYGAPGGVLPRMADSRVDTA